MSTSDVIAPVRADALRARPAGFIHDVAARKPSIGLSALMAQVAAQSTSKAHTRNAD